MFDTYQQNYLLTKAKDSMLNWILMPICGSICTENSVYLE